MEQNILISVVVPVYNVEAYVGRCVESILNQTYRNLEVILVDDGSKDRSGILCDEYAAKDARVRVIHKENGGLSSARNVGIEKASGEYITFVDSDDWIEADAYAHLLSVMQRYQVKLVCGGNYNVDSKTGERTLALCPEKEEVITTEEFVGRMFLWQGFDSSACDKLYHRSLLETFRYPEGKVCEDVAVTYRIVLGTQYAALSDRPYYNYFHRPDSITISTAKEITDKTFHFSRHTEEIYSYIKEHYPAVESQARFLRVRSLYHVLLLLEQTDADVRNRFAGEYRHARKELRKHAGFILKSPYFGKKEKITDILLIMNLYKTLRPLFHKA